MSKLTIDRFESHLEVTPRPSGGGATAGGSATAGGGLPSDPMRLKELLRPLVIEIVHEEIVQQRRAWGG